MPNYEQSKARPNYNIDDTQIFADTCSKKLSQTHRQFSEFNFYMCC